MTPQKFLLTAAVAAFMAGAVASAPSLAAEAESKDPIKITLFDWTGQSSRQDHGRGAEEGRLQCRVRPGRLPRQFAGMKTGDLTLAMEIWATTARRR
jgi:glycine betaine/proline transport system substrate-binding protein